MDMTCTGCGKTKDEEEFHWRSKRLGKRKERCRDCANAYNKAHYERNVQTYVDKSRKWQVRIREENYRRLLTYFETHHCVDCDESDPLVLTFDHVRGKKDYNVCAALLVKKWESVESEIEKCEVRCANCHMRKTAREGDWIRSRMVEERNTCLSGTRGGASAS